MKRSARGRAEQTGGKLGYKSGSLWTTGRASLMKGRFMAKRFSRTRDELEKLFPDIKKAQAKGISYSDVADLSRIGKETAKNMYKADSFQEYLALAKIRYGEDKQKRLQKKILADYMSEEKELKESLTPAAELPIFKAAEANINSKPTELYIYGLREDVFILAKVAEKMGLQLALTEQH